MADINRNEENGIMSDLYKQNNLDNDMLIQLFHNPFYLKIIQSEEFQRLKKVSFLGAIDYLSPKTKSNRYTHSLDVAKLALFISKQRNYNQEIQDHLVTAALLHDIGHAPFSHSMEPSFFNAFGINHHLASVNIINGQNQDSSLTKIIKEKVSVSTIIDLVEQISSDEFADIFNSKINVDTIDGIHKSLAFMNSNLNYDKYNLALASFIKGTADSVRKLDLFWKAKDIVYDILITSGTGAIADHMSKEYFTDNISRLDESYFYKKELSLLVGKKPIFKNFSKNIQMLKQLNVHETQKIDNIHKIKLDVTKRCYKINNNINIHEIDNLNIFISQRYECKKWSSHENIYYTICRSYNNKQFNLL